jgi:hypothetical protein
MVAMSVDWMVVHSAVVMEKLKAEKMGTRWVVYWVVKKVL